MTRVETWCGLLVPRPCDVEERAPHPSATKPAVAGMVPRGSVAVPSARLLESLHLNLSPDDIAVAEASGVTFLPATPDQVQRLSMQRKIFYAAGRALLATRGGGLYETVGTLEQVLDSAEHQRERLPVSQPGAMPDVATMTGTPEVRPEATPHPVAAEQASPPSAEAAPPRAGRRRRTALPRTERPADQGMVLPASVPSGEETPRPEEDGTANRQPRPGGRWRVAGAERRGRAGKHWSLRQR